MPSYASRLFELFYGPLGGFYDPLVRWAFLPLGGERRCRDLQVGWMALEGGERVAMLCCGTGSSELAIRRSGSMVETWGLDLALGQLVRAARRVGGRARYLAGDAAGTPFASSSFDRVVIAFALHEMIAAQRRAVLAEASRICRPRGRVVAIDHARPEGFWSRIAQAMWWGFWIPGNPEAATSRDLSRRGLAREMAGAGLEPISGHRTRPAWIEGVSARPYKPVPAVHE